MAGIRGRDGREDRGLRAPGFRRNISTSTASISDNDLGDLEADQRRKYVDRRAVALMRGARPQARTNSLRLHERDRIGADVGFRRRSIAWVR